MYISVTNPISLQILPAEVLACQGPWLKDSEAAGSICMPLYLHPKDLVLPSTS